MSELILPAIPPRRGGRRRDRHGRGPRGPLIPPTLPGWRSRAEQFDELVIEAAERLERRLPKQLAEVEFAVEEVPPSDPSPWERDSVALARYFPASPSAGLKHRVVVYRRPVLARCETPDDAGLLVREILAEQVAAMLGRAPEEVDPDYPVD